jgi:hypothetical protein
MNRLHITTAVLALALGTGQTGMAQPARSQSPQASLALAQPAAVASAVEEEAIEALRAMSRYLMTATTLEINTVGTLDVVTNDGQRIQLDGTTNYKIRRPGFVIDYRSDIKSRRFIYDGRTFTVYSPTLGFYSTVPAPPTNREVLEAAYNRFGIELPLEDLFRWGDGSIEDRTAALQSGSKVGTATLDGVATDHYAFREADTDWQVWIQQGDQPLPLKLVIVDRTDPARPTFTSRMSWRFNPTFTDADFTFVPDANARRIQMATFQGPGE